MSGRHPVQPETSGTVLCPKVLRMRLVRLLPERWQKFIREALKFGIVGGVNTVINYAVFNALALTVFVDGQLKATVIATIVATITSYLMNRHWTYRDRPRNRHFGGNMPCSFCSTAPV